MNTRPQEFQVILLVGGHGSRMYPLTEEMSKYLLPIANRPLISYQLEFLENAGFRGTTLNNRYMTLYRSNTIN